MTINRPTLTSVVVGNGRAYGKNLLTSELMERLVGDFDGDAVSAVMPTFTWTERYKVPPETYRYLATQWGTFHGYLGETHPRSMMPVIHRVYPIHRLHYMLKRRARFLEPWDPTSNRPPHRFWVPARRFAGFAAYPNLDVTYLDRPSKPAWDHNLYVEETSFKSWRHRPGTIIITYPEDFGGWKTISDVGSLRPSERRARYSSTSDGNGKPRKKKR